MAAATSSGCASFFNLRSSSSSSFVPKARKAPTSNGSWGGCGRIDGVAMWVINGVAAAFFASLEGCSCIRIATVEDADEGKELPLIRNDASNHLSDRDAGSLTADVRRRPSVGRGKRNGTSVQED